MEQLTQQSMFSSEALHGFDEIASALDEVNRAHVRTHAEVIIFLMTNPEWGAVRWLHKDYELHAIEFIMALVERLLNGDEPSSDNWKEARAITSHACLKTINQDWKSPEPSTLEVQGAKEAIKAVHAVATSQGRDATSVLYWLLEAAKSSELDTSDLQEQVRGIYR